MNYLSRAALASLASGLMAALGAPADAVANQPPYWGVTGSVPADGESYPANAALLFEGYRLSLTDIAVTVDGAPAALVPPAGLDVIAHVNPTLAAPAAARIEPTPFAGQTVVLRSQFCSEASQPPTCSERVVTYVATAPDESPPASPVGVTYERQAGGPSGTRCGGGEPHYFVNLPALPSTEGGARVTYLIEAFRDAALTDRAFSTTAFGVNVPNQVWWHELTGASSVGSLCVRVRAFDLAGHEAAEASVACDPWQIGADASAANGPAATAPSPLCAAVEGDEANAVAEARRDGDSSGACQLGVAGAARSPAPGWPLAAAFALALAARRKRRMRG